MRMYYIAWLDANDRYCVDAWASKGHRDYCVRLFKARGLTVLNTFED